MLYKYIYTNTCIDHRQSDCRFGVQILGTFSDIGDPMFLPVPSSSFQFLTLCHFPRDPGFSFDCGRRTLWIPEASYGSWLRWSLDSTQIQMLHWFKATSRPGVWSTNMRALACYDLEMSCHSPEKSKTCWSLIQPLGTHVRFSRINMRRCVQMSCGTGWIPVLNLHLVLELRYILVG